MASGVYGMTLILLLVCFLSPTIGTKVEKTIIQQTGFWTISSLVDAEDPATSSFLDILHVAVETDGFSTIRLNLTLRGSPPDSHLFSNRTLDDNLSYAWWIDADRDSSTGQHHTYLGSEYNIMTQASGGSPTGEWGARVDVIELGDLGGGPVQFVIAGNTISLLVSLSQIGGCTSFDYSVTTWGQLGGSSLGFNPETEKQTVYLVEQGFFNSIKIDDAAGDATSGAPSYVDIRSLMIRQIGQYVQFVWEGSGSLFNNDGQFYFIVIDTDLNPDTGQNWGGSGGELKIAIYQTAVLVYFDQVGNVIQEIYSVPVSFEGNKFFLNIEKAKIPSDRFNLYFESSGGTPYSDSGSLVYIGLQPSRGQISILIDSDKMVLHEKPPLINIRYKSTPIQLKTYFVLDGNRTELQQVYYNVSHPVAHDPRLGDPSSIISVDSDGTARYLREGYVFVTSTSEEYHLVSTPVIIATGNLYGNPETDNVLAVFPEDYRPEMSSYSFGYMMANYPNYIKTVNRAYDLMEDMYMWFKPFDGDKQIFALLVLAGHCGGNNNPLETGPCCYMDCGNGEPHYNVVIHEMGHNFAATRGMQLLTSSNDAKIGRSGFGEGVASLPVIYFAKDLYDHPEKYGFTRSSFEWQYYKSFLEQDIPYCKGELENFENMILTGQTDGIFDGDGKFGGVAVFCSLFQQYAYEFTNDTNPYKQEVIRRFLNLFPDQELPLFEESKVETYFAAAFSVAVGHDMKEKMRFWGFSIDDAFYSQVYGRLNMTYTTDLNNDGIVNIADVAILAKAYGSTPGTPRWNLAADLDKNGIVNIVDVALIAKDYGKTV